MKNKFLFFIFLTMMSGCSYSTFYVPERSPVYPPSAANEVVLTPQQQLESNYKVIGLVAISVSGDGEDAKEKLQEEAAKIGANAVMDLRLERFLGRTAASGTAVLVYQK